MDTNVLKASAYGLCESHAAGCDLGDGPDSPAFERHYFDPQTAISIAFADNADWLVEALLGVATKDRAAPADELHHACQQLQSAMDGGSIEARDLASRTLAGLFLTLVKTAGMGVLQDRQDDAWNIANLDARRANAYAARTYDRSEA